MSKEELNSYQKSVEAYFKDINSSPEKAKEHMISLGADPKTLKFDVSCR